MAKDMSSVIAAMNRRREEDLAARGVTGKHDSMVPTAPQAAKSTARAADKNCPTHIRLNLNVPADTFRRFKAKAANNGTTMTEVVNAAIARYLREE